MLIFRHEPVTKTAKEYARDEPDWDDKKYAKDLKAARERIKECQSNQNQIKE